MSTERDNYDWRGACDTAKMSRFMVGFYHDLQDKMWKSGHYNVGDADKRISRLMYDMRGLTDDEKIKRLTAYLENLEIKK